MAMHVLTPNRSNHNLCENNKRLESLLGVSFKKKRGSCSADIQSHLAKDAR